MYKPVYLAAALLLAAAVAAAQPGPAPTPANANSKPKRGAAGAGAPAPDWSGPYAARIAPEKLQADLRVLASDAYEGRATGEKGQKMAADYIAKAFAADGLAGPVPGSDNPYLQHFTLNHTGIDPASSVVVGGRTFLVNQDFYVALRDPASATGPMQPAFAGYGISTAGYADFGPADPALRAKDLLLLLGEPLSPAGQPLLGQGGQASAYGGTGFTEMIARGPALRALAPRATFRIMPSRAALARVPQEYPLAEWQGRMTLPGQPTDNPLVGQGPNVFFVSPELGAALLGTTEAGLAGYRQAVAAAGKPIASGFRPVAAQLHITEKTRPFTTENVLGYLEGSDRKEEVVVLSAHYDHVGVHNGVVYNGADDDGSGTVSVLAMARAFAQAKKEGHGPRRSLLFLANTAEEEALLGSQYYTDHPVLPLASTVADLHIDMLGRVDSVHQAAGNYVYIIGDDWVSDELRPLSEATNQQQPRPLALDYRYNTITDPQHLYRRSDHYNFAKHRVPIIFYFSGLHPDYHQPTDDVEKIDFPALAQRSQLVFRTAWALANRTPRPALRAPGLTASFVPAAPDLARYAGTYTSPQSKLKITISPAGLTLRAQTNDWQNFLLQPAGPGVFTFDQAGLRLDFAPDQPTFTLRQGGSSGPVFTKEVG